MFPGRFDLFLSYHTPDEEWVSQLAHELERRQVRVFFAPEALRAGDNLVKVLDESIKNSDAAVVVVSSGAANSKWVDFEVCQLVYRQLHGQVSRIIPLVLDTAAVMPVGLDSLLNITLPSPPSPERAAVELLKHLRSNKARPTRSGLAALSGPDQGLGVWPAVESPRQLETIRVEIGEVALMFLVLPLGVAGPVALAPAPFTVRQFLALYPDTADTQPAPVTDLPLTGITVPEMLDLCRDLSRRSGRSVRLPTPFEWATAYRAGSRLAFFFGAASTLLPHYARFGSAGPAPVSQFRPNPWGFFDMAGNVWEACHEETWGESAVGRGGSYSSSADQCSVNHWIPIDPETRSDQIGFRLALSN